jgi:hypothetical protein
MVNSIKNRKRKYISKKKYPEPTKKLIKSKSFTEGISIGQSKEEKSIKKQTALQNKLKERREQERKERQVKGMQSFFNLFQDTSPSPSVISTSFEYDGSWYTISNIPNDIVDTNGNKIMDDEFEIGLLKAIISRLSSEVNLNFKIWEELIEIILNKIGKIGLVENYMKQNDAMLRFRLFLYGSMDSTEIQKFTQDDLIILRNFFTMRLLHIDLNSVINTNTPVIGRGGSGVVYSVQPGNLAVKVLNIPEYTYRIIKNNIITYIKVLQNCENRFFCKLLGISTYTTNGKTSLAIITDYCGESLGDKLRKQEIIPFDDMCEIMFDIIKGIQHMHYSKIAHLDIKPDNILIYKSHSGHLNGKLIDFGLSQDWSSPDDIPTALFYGTSCFVDKYAQDKLRYPYTPPSIEPTKVDRRTHSPNIIQMDIYALARTFMFLYSDNTLTEHRRNHCVQKHQKIRPEYEFFQRLGICILYKLKKRFLRDDELVLKNPEERMDLDNIIDVLINPEKICHIDRLEPPYFI